MLSWKPQKAVHSTDPGQSAWWLLPSAGGIIVGGICAAASQFFTHNTASSVMVGVVSGTVGGLGTATPKLRDWVSARSRRRQIAEATGAGVDISGEPLEALRVHRSNQDSTEFIPRDIQDEILDHLSNGTPVLIEGPSMAGKTRLALETIRSHWPNTPCWFPRNDGDIEKLLSSNQQPSPETFILLDDLDRFLSNQSLTLGLLNQWVDNSCTIIATMMHSQYMQHSDRTDEQVTGWDVVNRFEKLTLNSSLSTTELNAVKSTSYADQIQQIENIGLGPLLGCAEAVRTAFTDELEKHSWCGALVKAAADWRRIGLGPASREQLITFSKEYSKTAWGAVDWDDAWQQATKPIKNTVSLIQRVGDNRWEILDIIADEANWKISSSVLDPARKLVTTAPQLLSVAIAMAVTGNTNETPQIFKEAITLDPSNTRALGSYAIYLKNQGGDPEEIQRTYEAAVNFQFCEPEIIVSYAIYLQQNKDDDLKKITELYERALSLNPHNPSYLTSYALFLDGELDDYEGAKKKFEESLKVDPYNVTTLISYATTLMKQKENDEIEHIKNLYERALKIDPDNDLAITAYGHFLQIVYRDNSVAENMYRAALSINPGNEMAARLLLRTIGAPPSEARTRPQQPTVDESRPHIKGSSFFTPIQNRIDGR